VSIEASNAPADRELVHTAFRRALARTKLQIKETFDIGETDVRPIKNGKEQLFDEEKEVSYE